MKTSRIDSDFFLDVHSRVRLLPLLDDSGLLEPWPVPCDLQTVGIAPEVRRHHPEARKDHDRISLAVIRTLRPPSNSSFPSPQTSEDRVLPVHVHELLPRPFQQQRRRWRIGGESELLLGDAGSGREDVQLALPGTIDGNRDLLQHFYFSFCSFKLLLFWFWLP